MRLPNRHYELDSRDIGLFVSVGASVYGLWKMIEKLEQQESKLGNLLSGESKWFNKIVLRAVLAGISWSAVALSDWIHRRDLQEAVEIRRKERQKLMDELSDHLEAADVHEPNKWVEIRSWDTDSLIEKLRNEQVSPVLVLRAFQDEALRAQKLTNCVTLFFIEAESYAADLELRYKGMEKPPLYGLPFSVKENIAVKGYDCTAGYAQHLNQPIAQDSTPLQAFKALGVVPFAQTNVPQNLFIFLASNPIYGTTRNPHQTDRSSGGSSGGEGALIGHGGSPLGVGGDIAGSIRLPSHWCGISGLRPSSGRFARRGTRAVAPGVAMIGASNGPMARDAKTLSLTMRALYQPDSTMFANDPYVVPLPFNDELYKSDGPLRIGWYDEDGWFPVTPAVRRAVHITKDLLAAQGHTLVQWSPPDVAESFRLIMAGCMLDGGKYVRDHVDNDIAEPLNEPMLSILRVKDGLKKGRAKLLKLLGYKRRALMMESIPTTPHQVRLTYERMTNYRNEFVQQWKEMDLDAVICPPNVAPALPQDIVMKVFPIFSYTALYNVLDFPGGVVPVTKVLAEDEEEVAKSYPASDYESRLIKDSCSSGTVGLPIGVQCVALPYKEEIILRLMEEIQGKLGPKPHLQ